MGSDLDFTFQGTLKNYVRIVFQSVEWEGIEDVLHVNGNVYSQGYAGYFSGYSGLFDLRAFLLGIKKGIAHQPLTCFLHFTEYELMPAGSERISISFLDPFLAVVHGNISNPDTDELLLAKLEFKFKLDIDVLRDTLCDLETIYRILRDRYNSARRKRH